MSKDKIKEIRGVVLGHSDGYGFLRPDVGKEDFYLSPTEMLKVMHGDQVIVKIYPGSEKQRTDAVILEVVKRAQQDIVGRVVFENGLYLVVPEEKRINHDIVVSKNNLQTAKIGQIVVVSITDQPTKVTPPIGKIIEVVGDSDEPGIENEIALRKFKIPHHFPEEILQMTEADMSKLCAAKSDKKRIDLTEIDFFTVDGSDAKDFDDAIYVEDHEEAGWRALVAIADVSSYVHPGDSIDQEAFLRGTSVYFPRSVIPMLPEFLSNNLCSLNPDMNRMVLVCDMVVSADGDILAYQFYEATIRSRARFSYEDFWEIIKDDDAEKFQDFGNKSLVAAIFSANNLFKALHRNRKKRGALDFETVETSIQLNEEGKIQRIIPVKRTNAHKIIEECMIAANICAAHFIFDSKKKCLYRIHEDPDEEKVENLKVYLKSQGVSFAVSSPPSPEEYSALLEQIKSRSDSEVLQSLILRSMKQACYSPKNTGHFALALKKYTHFTSPIRRYPDLLVHRVIKEILYKKNFDLHANFKTRDESIDTWEVLGEQASLAERRAEEATRDVISLLKCQFMQERIGEQMRGIITNVVPFGLFVTLDNLFVEGLIHVSELGQEFFQYIPTSHELRGERTGKRFKLYDRVLIQLMRVDVPNRKIQFALLHQRDGKPAKNVTLRRKRKISKDA
ncbi:ribonuclease R [Betaproteobacteria bacterium]|nr:ribonuclease R [Betaproteobacteria bacterium]